MVSVLWILVVRSEDLNKPSTEFTNMNTDTIHLVNENDNYYANITNYLTEDDLPPVESPINDTDSANDTEKYVSCIPNQGDSVVQIVNDTELIKLLLPKPSITKRDTQATCIVILFYSKYCPFSSMAAPHYNALPRAFPTIKMVAINAMWYHIFNAQNGVVGVPSLLLFHNGKPVAKFNDSEYTLELFSKFLTKHTGINAEEKSFVTSADFTGPVSSVPSKEDDILLFLSWSFIVICVAYYFSKSKYWTWIVDTIQNTWRESEAQALHEHAD